MAYSQADFLGYTTGDILYASATDVLSKRAIGTSGQVLTVSGGVPTWATSSTGAMVQLQAWTVLGGSSATISIGSISGSYNNLYLLFALRTDSAGTNNDGFYMRFNSDSTAANYYSYTVRTNGTTGANTATERLGVTATGIEHNLALTAATAPSGYRGVGNITIYDYASTSRIRQTNCQFNLNRANTTGNVLFGTTTGLWTNTSNAITQIDLLPVTGTNFVTGSAYALYAF